MIGYLQGEIIEHGDGRMLIAVGDRASSGCVGYSVAVPHRASYGAHFPKEKIELFIYTHVREEAFDLYGFVNQYEKELFLTLLSVNGVGPKSALGILSSADPSQLVEGIIQADQAFLTGLPGVGKKTAERIVVELRDVVRKKIDSGVFSRSTQRTAQMKLAEVGSSVSSSNLESHSRIFQDAKSALLGLGYRDSDIQQLLNRIIETTETPPRKAEDLIKTALRQLV